MRNLYNVEYPFFFSDTQKTIKKGTPFCQVLFLRVRIRVTVSVGSATSKVSKKKTGQLTLSCNITPYRTMLCKTLLDFHDLDEPIMDSEILDHSQKPLC